MRHGEEWVQRGQVELCIERFGQRDAAPLLLIHGACASMLYGKSDSANGSHTAAAT